MYFVSGCDNDITQSRSSLWGLKKNENDKTSFLKILKVQQENGEKKNVPLCGIEPALSGRQANTYTITLYGPM